MTNSEDYISTKRIETLVDGIFAISMTLMVLSIQLPDPMGDWTNPMVWNVLSGQLTNIIIYAYTFIILTSFWIGHHRGFNRVKRADNNFLWLNMIWLLFVALVPFSTSLAGDFGNTTPAALFFNSNLFLIGLFSFLIRRQVIIKELSDESYEESSSKLIFPAIFPLLALVAITLSFFIPSWSYFPYLLVPLFIRVLQHKQNKAK